MKTTRRCFLQSSTLAGASLLLPCASATELSAAPSADLWETLRTRRSVRQFKSDPVPDADLERILAAAASAPTSGNQQPWKFLVVRDPAKIAALKTACLERALARNDPNQPLTEEQRTQRAARAQKVYDGYLSAPVYVVVLTDNQSTYPDYNHWDGPLAAGYLMLAARALGYGTVFITDSIPDEITRQVFAIPERYTRVCIAPIGVPVSWPTAPKKKHREEFIVHDTF